LLAIHSVINNEPVFDPLKIKEKGKSVLLINNGIHPGEPAGIDASLQFADDILYNNTEWAERRIKDILRRKYSKNSQRQN